MGSLTAFNLLELKTRYNLTAFVETGTWRGDGVECARKAGFETIYSIELHREFFEKACTRFQTFSHIKIIQGTSLDGLPQIFDVIANRSVLWWLDAHLQDVYGMSAKMTERFPLEDELALISKFRDIANDLFIMDDLRIYEDGPFAHGSCHTHQKCSKPGIGFVYTYLGNTHTIEKRYEHEGYIVATPRI